MTIQILIVIAALALFVPAFIALSFFISSIWENERRASILARCQFLGMWPFCSFSLGLLSAGFSTPASGHCCLLSGTCSQEHQLFSCCGKRGPTRGRSKGAKAAFEVN